VWPADPFADLRETAVVLAELERSNPAADRDEADDNSMKVTIEYCVQ